MQRRGLLLLVAVAVAAGVLAAVVLSRGDRAGSGAAATGGRALPGLAGKLDQVAALRLTRGAVTVDFRLGNHGWTVVEKGNYPADQDRVRRLLLQLAELELMEPKTDKPELLARLDLDDPAAGKSTEIGLQSRSGAPLGRIVIGRARPSDVARGEAGTYVRQVGSDQAWLARGAFALGGDALSWLDRRIIDIAPARVASVVLTAADGAAVIVARDSPDQPFAIDTPPADARPKPDAALAAPAGALEALTLTDVKPAAERPSGGERGSTAALTTFDGLVVGLRLSPATGGDWLTLAATGSGKAQAEAQAIGRKLAAWTFRIPADRAKLLRTTLSDLLLPRGS
ncbi:MAG TPA: DUF4340 domain-containing protein [Stellaceae bacterium]|nr:DUF4340 domain-containing protein [Stellaceae bacterium]